MLQLTNIKLPPDHQLADLEDLVRKTLQLRDGELISWRIARRSLDARRKGQVHYLYTVWAETGDDRRILRRLSSGRKKKPAAAAAPVHLQAGMEVSCADVPQYRFPAPGTVPLRHRPVIVGSGPAGLFAAWMLAMHGYRPIVLEMGDPALERQKKIEEYWRSGIPDPASNVQFGEGGAGTFSDGKLNTGVLDSACRNQEVLRIFTEAGAPEDILYESRPHIGTDILIRVVQEMRRRICEAGGDVYFRTEVTDLLLREDGLQPHICGVKARDGRVYESDHVVLAIGHSARATFRMLAGKPLQMEPKAFAVGVRAEHPQEMINRQQYGPQAGLIREPASYRLAAQLPSGRRVYTFCMCPGGYVINAASEDNTMAVNGMSYHARDSRHANSAVIVSVTPEDFLPYGRPDCPAVLNGMLFQYALERAAWQEGGGAAPVQRFEDFRMNRCGGAGALTPCHKGQWTYANVRSLFPEEIAASLEEGLLAFDDRIPGFAMPDALLTGVESRTSSPVRIVRDSGSLESTIGGLYPCGEGAGYAGGITSAAMDGIRVAEKIAAVCRPFPIF